MTEMRRADASVDLPDGERGVGVAVDPVEEDRDVEVDDVAVDERPVVGDAVADDLVDRRAQRLGERAVVQRARIAAAPDALLVAQGVELVGGHPGRHRGADVCSTSAAARPATRMRSMTSGVRTCDPGVRIGTPVSA